MVPGQSRMSDAAGLQPAPDLADFDGGVRTQTVIDGDRQNGAASCLRPAVAQQDKCHAVRSAGNSDTKTWSRFERTEPGHEPGEFGNPNCFSCSRSDVFPASAALSGCQA